MNNHMDDYDCTIADHWDPQGIITSASDPAEEFNRWKQWATTSPDWSGREFTLADFEDYIKSLADPVTSPLSIADAISHLRMARHFLASAGANNARQYVSRAIKSAEGALRHANRADIRKQRAAGAKPKRAHK